MGFHFPRKRDGLPLAARPMVPKTLPELLAAHERIIIISALQRFGFSRTKTAVSLGVSRGYLWRRMRGLHIDFSALPKVPAGRPKKRSNIT